MEFTIYHDSRKGGRKTNQDRVGYTYSRDSLLMVVCDGMGGHLGGEVAAHIVVQLFLERFAQEAQPMLRSPTQFLSDTMNRAHHALLDYAGRFKLGDTPRTTCVVAIVQANYAYWAHAGDSRLYLFRNRRILHRTRDHSKVQMLIDSGHLDPMMAAEHPDRNKVFSCLGGDMEPTIDYSPRMQLIDGDVFLLCTDGAWGPFLDSELAPWMCTGSVLNTTPLLLAEAARRVNDQGDNLSAIALRWGAAGAAADDERTLTQTMRMGEFTTQMDQTMTLSDGENHPGFTDSEITNAISEIQNTLKRYGRRD